MLNPVIQIENLSKQYRLGYIGSGTIRGDFQRLMAKVLGREDPMLRIGDENLLTASKGEYVWALKDINLKIDEGEVLGIIGKNGAGKSTLLKILSRVTGPTTGSIKIKGRIASLLEVGTGFHPELTGKENIYLNGAILGMSKNEIRSKFDEIIDFAGIQRYIYTPVKRYSTGMFVRLAFAVAAHLDSEILVVDEVLAVGDAEFQKKAIGKMQDVSSMNGRTVLFVSHNMNSINSLCSKTIILNNGRLDDYGTTERIISKYLSSVIESRMEAEFETGLQPGSESCKLIETKVRNHRGEKLIRIDQPVIIEMIYEVHRPINGVPNINLYSAEGTHVFFSTADETDELWQPGFHKSEIQIPPDFLNSGLYHISVYFTTLVPYKIHFEVKNTLTFEIIEDVGKREIEYYGRIPGIIRPKMSWKTYKL